MVGTLSGSIEAHGSVSFCMHHANLLIGSRTWGYGMLPDVERGRNSDVLRYEAEQFTIANARSLVSDATLRPVERDHRTFIIACESILHEAQNALLKLFEEPNPQTVFYLIVPREDMLLPTLRSRLHLLATEGVEGTGDAFENFRALPYAERLVQIGERLSAEDGAWVLNIVQGFEEYAERARDEHLLREAIRTSSYIRTSGSSKKMLLEHMALML